MQEQSKMRTRTTGKKPAESSAVSVHKRVEDAAQLTNDQLDQVSGGVMKATSDTQSSLASNLKAS
jgi:hypothetical protein